MNIAKNHGIIASYKIFIFIWIIIYVALAQLDLSLISDTMNADSENILKLIDSKDNKKITERTDSAYLHTAIFFSYIPRPLLQPFILLLGCATLILLMRGLRNTSSMMLAWLLSLPTIILILIRPQKETIVILLSIAVLRIFTSNARVSCKVFAAMFLYGVYGYLFRQYYFMIMLTFCGLLVFLRSNIRVRIFMLLMFMALFFILPEHILVALQGPRDSVNFIRLLLNEPGSRTAFMNLFYPDTHIKFICNYIYAFLRLNFAVFFDPGIREIFLLAILSLYSYLVYIGVKARSQEAFLCSCLVLAHLIVYCVFEPDLGSYLRHVSSTIIYLVPMLIMVDRRKLDRCAIAIN